MKLLVLGDSIAKGVVYDDLNQKYIFTKNSFASRMNNLGYYEIDNNAMMGCTIEKGLKNFDRVKPEITDYEYIILEFGGNDCDFDWATVAITPECDHQPKTPVDIFKTLYIELITRIKNTGAQPIVLTLPPIDAVKYFKWISRGLDAEAILRFLGDIHHIDRWHQMFNIAVMEASNITAVPLLDITTPFLRMVNFQKCLCTDGIHPNDEGHKIIFETLIKEVNAKIAPITKSGRIWQTNQSV